MDSLTQTIIKHSQNSKELKKIYLGNKGLKYDKAMELMKQQDIEYKKMKFFIQLKRELREMEMKNEIFNSKSKI